MKTLPDGTEKLFIARQPIKDMAKYGLHHVKSLAPSIELLKDFKAGNISWNEYVWRFRQEMMTKKDVLDFVYEFLKKKDVAFICYCCDEHCHRFILGHYFQELGIEVKKEWL